MERPQIRWYNPALPPFVLEGFPFFAKDGMYRRMPLNPEWTLPEGVEHLADHTAGGQIRFRARFKTIKLRVALRAPHNMDHMTPVGQCGFDLYLAETGTPRFTCVTRFIPTQDSYEVTLIDLPEAKMYEAVINFPLYMGVREVFVGLDADAVIEAPSPRAVNGKIVVYGTSITQGGCANRPGMVYTNILSRRLNAEVVNLGFSGSGRCEPEVAYTIREIENMSLYVHDAEANVGAYEDIASRYPRFVRILREKYPTLPILIATKIPYARELVNPADHELRLRKKELQRTIVEQFRAEGDKNIYFADGETFFDGPWEEYTVDGVHCTDLGFLKLADGMEPVIRQILGL